MLADLEQNLDHCLVLLIPPPPHPLLRSKCALALEGEGIKSWHAHYLARRFPQRAWIAVELLNSPNDKAQLEALRELSAHSGLPLVATGDVHMHVRSRKPLQDTLTAIRLGVTVDAAGYQLQPNAERHLRSRLRLTQMYPPELLAETLHIAGRCDFNLDVLRYEYPDEIVPQGHTPTSYLRELTEQGLSARFPQGTAAKVRALVEKELALIHELEYEPFFVKPNQSIAAAMRKLCSNTRLVIDCLRMTKNSAPGACST